MSNKKAKTIQVATYFVNDNGTKYVKFGPKKDKNKQVVGESPFPLVINEGDVLFVNVFDEDFKDKHGIPDFIVGNLQKPLDEDDEEEAPKAKKGKKQEPSDDKF